MGSGACYAPAEVGVCNGSGVVPRDAHADSHRAPAACNSNSSAWRRRPLPGKKKRGVDAALGEWSGWVVCCL